MSVTRYQVELPKSPCAPEPHTGPRILEGAGRIIGTGEPHQLAHASSDSARSGDAPSALPFVAKTVGGRVLNDVSEIDEKTTFRLPGGMTSGVAGMVGAGLLVRTADGKYRLPDPSNAPKKEESREEETFAGKEFSDCFSPDLHGFIKEVDQKTSSPHATNAIAASLIDGAIRGDTSAAVQKMVGFGGVEPADAQAMLDGALEEAAKGTALFIEWNYEGVSGREVVEFAANLPPRQRADFAMRIFHSDKRAIAELVSLYKSRQPIEAAKERMNK